MNVNANALHSTTVLTNNFLSSYVNLTATNNEQMHCSVPFGILMCNAISCSISNGSGSAYGGHTPFALSICMTAVHVEYNEGVWQPYE